jgi:NAD(P)-dependent dehydrogenase (short-subunit alcohol dehydrogenase family)
MPGELTYVATKGAIEAFTLSLASELAPLGITVSAVDPGATDTGWMTERIRRERSVRSGVAKLNQPEDAARVIVFLASDAARHLTGQVIHAREVRFSRSTPAKRRGVYKSILTVCRHLGTVPVAVKKRVVGNESTKANVSH